MTVRKPEQAGNGTVWIWGDNMFGQQCDGTTESRLLPAPVAGLDDVVTVTGGGGHVAVMRADRSVWAWGRNDYGQCGDGTFENRDHPVRVEGMDDVVSLVGGGGHSLALAADGTVWAWGHNGRGDLGDGTSDNRSRPVKVKGLKDVAQLAWGGGHGIALDRDGQVWTWGHNIVGQCGDGTSITRLEPVRVKLDGAVEISGGGGHTLVKTEDGGLWGWGRNDRGQVGDGSMETLFEPAQVKGLEGVDIDVFLGGYFHTIVLAKDKTVWVWGNNDSGQLGDGTLENNAVPRQVAGLSDVKAVAAGGGRNEWGPGGHCLAILSDDTIVTWGLNDAGQLGDGTTDNSGHPVTVKGLADVKAITACGGYSLALL